MVYTLAWTSDYHIIGEATYDKASGHNYIDPDTSCSLCDKIPHLTGYRTHINLSLNNTPHLSGFRIQIKHMSGPYNNIPRYCKKWHNIYICKECLQCLPKFYHGKDFYHSRFDVFVDTMTNIQKYWYSMLYLYRKYKFDNGSNYNKDIMIHLSKTYGLIMGIEYIADYCNNNDVFNTIKRTYLKLIMNQAAEKRPYICHYHGTDVGDSDNDIDNIDSDNDIDSDNNDNGNFTFNTGLIMVSLVFIIAFGIVFGTYWAYERDNYYDQPEDIIFPWLRTFAVFLAIVVLVITILVIAILVTTIFTY